MNDIITVWVRRLRSGDYPQGRGRLRRDLRLPNGKPTQSSGYCCLGVLCEMAVEAGAIGKIEFRPKEFAGGLEETATYYDAMGDLPSEGVWVWAGLPGSQAGGNVYLDAPHDLRTLPQMGDAPPLRTLSLAYLNDTLRLTFDQIADLIDYFGLTRGDIVPGAVLAAAPQDLILVPA